MCEFLKFKFCQNLKFWQILTIILIISFSLVLLFLLRGPKLISPEKAGELAIKYINENILQGMEATLEGVEKKQGIFLIKVKVGEQKFDSYMTLDGRYLFPTGFDLTQVPAEPEKKPAKAIEPRETPEVHLYTMSYCPFGNQAEEIIYPVQKLLGDKVKIEPHYVIYSNYRGGGPEYCLDKENKYCSMHGIDELKQNVRELCIFKYQPEKFWDYLMAVNKKCNLQDIEICWEGVAKEEEINTTLIKKCQKDEALALLEKEVELNQKYNVTGSPDLVINGVSYRGKRTPEAYKAAICSAFLTPPDECQQTLKDEGPAAAGSCH